GATTDPALTTAPLLLLDVGGGSTEFILGRGQQQHFSKSFPVGTVRLLERFPHSDPPNTEELQHCRAWLRQFLTTEVRPQLQSALQREAGSSQGGQIQLVGTGGTASILGAMEAQLDSFDRQRIEAIRLTRDRIEWQANHLWSLTLEQRKRIVGLPQNRADVI